MLPGAAPFLAAITARPEDDLPRLIYADWLEEQGDPDRAEFIRLQIERFRTKEEKRYPRPMKARIAELRAANEAQWRADLPQLPGVTWGRWWRGFVSEALFATPAALIEQAANVFSITPIRVVQVSGLNTDSVVDVCRVPQLRDLYGLRLDDVALDVPLWRALCDCDWFRRIQHLIAYPARPMGGWRAFAQLQVAIVQIIRETATREDSRLRLIHLEVPDVEGSDFQTADGRKVWMKTGLDFDDFWPL